MKHTEENRLQKQLANIRSSLANLQKQFLDLDALYDLEEREADERAQQLCVDICSNLYKDLVSQFDAERKEIIAKHDKKCTILSGMLASVWDKFKQTKENVTATMNEIEKLKMLIADNELVFSERDQAFKKTEKMLFARNKLLKDKLLKKVKFMKKLKNENQSLRDEYESSLTEINICMEQYNKKQKAVITEFDRSLSEMEVCVKEMEMSLQLSEMSSRFI